MASQLARATVLAAMLGCAHGKKAVVEEGPRRKGAPLVEARDHPRLGTCVDWTTQRQSGGGFQLLGKVQKGAGRQPNREGTEFTGDSKAIEWTIREMPGEADGEQLHHCSSCIAQSPLLPCTRSGHEAESRASFPRARAVCLPAPSFVPPRTAPLRNPLADARISCAAEWRGKPFKVRVVSVSPEDVLSTMVQSGKLQIDHADQDLSGYLDEDDVENGDFKLVMSRRKWYDPRRFAGF